MSARLIQSFLTFGILIIGTSAYGITFKEALIKCRGLTTPKCEEIRSKYRRLKEAQRLKIIRRQTIIQETPQKEIVKAEAKPEPKWDERGEIKSPFGVSYFSEIAGIGKSNADGSSQLGGYLHFDGTYATRWDATFYVRVPLLIDFSTATNEEETLTALDPFFGISGTVWKSGQWSFWNRARFILPLSQSSVDNGVTFSWGIDSSISYSGKGFSSYLQLQPRGQFFGFGTEGERNNGSLSIEFSINSIKLTENSGLSFFFASGFSRKIGPDLGALVFTDNSAVVTALWDYKFNKHLSVSPGVKYNLDDADASLIVWLSGALF